MADRQMTFRGELVLGAALGVVVGAQVGAPPSSVAVLAVGGAMLVYFASCWRFPFAACPLPWCRSRLTRGDEHGHFRKRRPCVLHPGGEYVRIGARLMGRGE